MSLAIRESVSSSKYSLFFYDCLEEHLGDVCCSGGSITAPLRSRLGSHVHPSRDRKGAVNTSEVVGTLKKYGIELRGGLQTAGYLSRRRASRKHSRAFSIWFICLWR